MALGSAIFSPPGQCSDDFIMLRNSLHMICISMFVRLHNLSANAKPIRVVFLDLASGVKVLYFRSVQD